MAREVRTNVIVSTKSEGIPKTQQELTNLAQAGADANDAQAKGFEESRKAWKEAGKEASKAADSQAKGFEASRKTQKIAQQEASKTADAKAQGFEKAGKTRKKEKEEVIKLSKETEKAIEDQVKGFEKSGKAYKKAQKEISRLEGELQGLSKQQIAINKLMDEVGDKSTGNYKELAAELKRVDEQASKITKTISNLDRAFVKAQAARQGFVQGLGQGLAPGAMQFIQRGPGMRQQMAGAAVGRAARAAPGMVGGMFSGAQGAAAALRGIPLVGGAMAATIERPMAQAQQAMQYHQTRMQTMPFLGGLGLQQQMRGAGARAQQTITDVEIERQAERDRIHEAFLPKPKHYQQAEAEKMAEEKAAEAKARGEKPIEQKAPLSMKAAALAIKVSGFKVESKEPEPKEVSEEVEGRAMDLAGQEAEKRTRENLQRERRQRGSRARQGVQRRRLGLGMGVQFGMNLNEELQTRAGIQQAGGGYGTTQQERQLNLTGMAAQRAFQVQGGVSGAFLQAGRRGGLVGAEGDASEMLTDSLADAMKLGLEGSEINDYLQQMASGINSWKTTGIPFNKQSMADIAGTLGTMGMGGVRGMTVAGGVSRAAEQLSRTGPQSVGQLMMLQTMGGMTPGKTGMEAMEDALIKLENKQFKGEDFKELLDRLVGAGGGGAEGRRVAYGIMSGMGINITRGELKDLDEGKTPETWDQERKRRIKGEQLAKRVATPEGLVGAAAAAVPGPVKKQAALENQQIKTGDKMIGSMQALDKVAQRITDKMGNIGPTVERIANSMDDFTKTMIAAMESKKGFFETLLGGDDE